MSKDKVRSQLRRLYYSNFIGNASIAGAAWVLLLVSDGYSLIQVGLAETVFHIVSLSCEIPSGVFADVFGRKKSLIVSCLCAVMSAVVRGSLRCRGISLQDLTAHLRTIPCSRRTVRMSTTDIYRNRPSSTASPTALPHCLPAWRSSWATGTRRYSPSGSMP